MKRCLLTLTFLLVGTGAALAQGGPQPQGIVGPPKSEPEPGPELEPEPEAPPLPDVIVSVIEPTARMTTKIAFVIDSSGSMDNNRRMGMAITFAKNILGAGGDELQCAVISFKSEHVRWPGVPHDGIGEPPPKGWAYFPGVPQLESAQKWLNAQGAKGGTSPNSAMSEALAEKVKKLTIVLITDGEFDPGSFKTIIKEGQKAREDSGLGRAVILVIGIGDGADTEQHLRDVGKTERGGLYVVQAPKLPDEDFEGFFDK